MSYWLNLLDVLVVVEGVEDAKTVNNLQTFDYCKDLGEQCFKRVLTK